MEGGHDPSALAQFFAMMVRPDNIPIIGMLVLVLWFTYVGFREARINDELSAQGREDEILRRMQE